MSIIIPTLNEEEALQNLLSELLGQSPGEIIISDGGSKDATKTIAQKYGANFISGSPGRGNQLNRGAEIARGDILLFLHADSQLEAIGFSQIEETIAAGKQWGCFTLAFNEPGLIFDWIAWASSLRVRLFSSCYGDQGIFCNRNFFRSLGGFPPYPFLEDLAFSLQARRWEKATLLNARITTSSRRFRKNGTLRTLWKMQMVKGLYILGYPPEKLLPYYRGGRALWKRP